MKTIDPNYLERFEHGLDPHDIAQSKIPAEILGFGEISTIFMIGDDQTRAYKRMPLFHSVTEAETYARNYRIYCHHLKQAGLNLPEDEIRIVTLPGRPVVLYLIQQQFPPEWFAHKLLHTLEAGKLPGLGERIRSAVALPWKYNQINAPTTEIALDGQISNWVFENGDVEKGLLYYIDTSTPLFRLDGVEQLNPELLLQSAPGFLRWIIRSLFLQDVMERYYDQRQVLIDLVANLMKEQLPDLIDPMLNLINSDQSTDLKEITNKEIQGYYREDRIIWTLFLAFRRTDRWIKKALLHKRYEFILPGKIKR